MSGKADSAASLVNIFLLEAGCTKGAACALCRGMGNCSSHDGGLTAALRCRFLVGSDSSDDEDDKRVVRSAKDRRGEELRTICDEMRVGAG